MNCIGGLDVGGDVGGGGDIGRGREVLTGEGGSVGSIANKNQNKN